jgi:hypothetical protein
LYSPFGDGGVFWIDPVIEIDTKAARKNNSKYPVIERTFKNYLVKNP